MTDEERQSNYGSDTESEGYEGGRGGSGFHGRGRRRAHNMRIEKTDVELYKDIETLRRFLTERGQIRPRRQTGLCARDQRRLAIAVKRARHLALLPFVTDSMRGE